VSPAPPGGFPRDLAQAVRDTCRDELSRAWEEALASGLCAEGAWEVALGALAHLDPEELVRRARERAVGGDRAGHAPT
jgi:hypothetical protein